MSSAPGPLTSGAFDVGFDVVIRHGNRAARSGMLLAVIIAVFDRRLADCAGNFADSSGKSAAVVTLETHVPTE